MSAFESFFSEQRPFFQEGTDIFQFGRTQTFNTFGNPLVFYSRRIGRQPQGKVANSSINPEFTDVPNQTTIASAVKLSGKTTNGLSLGFLNAFTLREKAQFRTITGKDGSISVEPATNYLVGRVKQDFNNGNTILGAYGSTVNRFIHADYLENSLHKSSYIGGIDFEHSWNNREWIMSGTISGTNVNGTPETIMNTQQSSARYYNRVDADHLSIQSDKTSLSGYAGEISFSRVGGEHFKGSLTYSVVSPGYEVNDIGFEQRADYQAASYFLRYQENKPTKPFRSYSFNIYANHAWNFGSELINNSYGSFTRLRFTNLWSLNFNAGLSLKSFNDRLLRGGPLAESPSSNYYSAVVNSDNSKKISFALGHLRRQSRSNEYERDLFINLNIRPASYIQLSIKPNLNYSKDTDQFIQSVQDPLAVNTFGKRYVFADIERTTVSSTFRVDWTFTPEISLQTYIRPFISSGNFYNYKEFTTPRELDFAIYGEERGTIQQSYGSYNIDPDGKGPAQPFSFGEQDFNFKAVQTNAVFRWEFQPGSTFYLVWQQDRSQSTLHNNFRLNRDFNRLLNAKPTNVLLVKFSYWLGS